MKAARRLIFIAAFMALVAACAAANQATNLRGLEEDLDMDGNSTDVSADFFTRTCGALRNSNTGNLRDCFFLPFDFLVALLYTVLCALARIYELAMGIQHRDERCAVLLPG